MIELIKQTMLMGVGLAAMTGEKIEALAHELASEAKLSSEKGREFVKDVMDRAEKARADFQSAVKKAVNDNLEKTNVATRDDIAALNARLERLEQLLAARQT